jgi:S-adenosylmethionine:tRNA-ribosyltransferase-isomerase (queuine synthetase)
MTQLEIRVAALQFLTLRLCASTAEGVQAQDPESKQMQREILKVLDEAIVRARHKRVAAG